MKTKKTCLVLLVTVLLGCNQANTKQVSIHEEDDDKEHALKAGYKVQLMQRSREICDHSPIGKSDIRLVEDYYNTFFHYYQDDEPYYRHGRRVIREISKAELLERLLKSTKAKSTEEICANVKEELYDWAQRLKRS